MPVVATIDAQSQMIVQQFASVPGLLQQILDAVNHNNDLGASAQAVNYF